MEPKINNLAVISRRSLYAPQSNLILEREKEKPGDDYIWRKYSLCSTPEARSMLSLKYAEQFSALPLAKIRISTHEIALSILLPEPLDAKTIRDIQFVVGLEIFPETAPLEIVRKALHSAYKGNSSILKTALRQAENNIRSINNYPSTESLSDISRNKAIPQLLESTLHHAKAVEASDIYLEPQSETNYTLKYRIDGSLKNGPNMGISVEASLNLIRRVKVLCKLDVTDNRLPQEGGFLFDGSGISMRLRVSCLPTVKGEKIVIRLLDQSLPGNIDKKENSLTEHLQRIGFTYKQQLCYVNTLAANHGSIIFSGPTGSGKSTLMCITLKYFKAEEMHIVTIEDPVERIIPGATQLQVNHNLNLDYADLLKHVLRQDPDIIMLGEIRDSKSAKTALTAGITGHLMFTTVHASNCLEVILRLQELGVSDTLIALSTKLIVSQRLVGLNCPHCLVAENPPDEVFLALNLPFNTKFYRSLGCEECLFSGILGRIGIFELLQVNDNVRFILLNKNTSSETSYYQELRNVTNNQGAMSFGEQLRCLLSRGKISISTTLKTLGMSPEFFNFH